MPVPQRVTHEHKKISRKPGMKIQMGNGLDLVTSLRTEWVSAALCTNQIPRASKSVLQIGTEDGRAVNFVPRTVEELITSSTEENGEVTIGCRRQLKQQNERRGSGLDIKYADQAADELTETKNESVDVVISLQAGDRMVKSGMDWKKSIKETARVLKPGGRFIFVEKADIEGTSYIEEVMGLISTEDKPPADKGVDQQKEGRPIFELVGYDDVDLVLVPHIAGVVTKAMTKEQITNKISVDAEARMAELSINTFERGLKRRKKKKKKEKKTDEAEN